MRKIEKLKLLFVALIMFMVPIAVKGQTIGPMQHIDIDVNAPTIGEHYSLATNGSGYTVVSQEWRNETTGQAMKSSEVFESGTKYSYFIRVNTVSGNASYSIPKFENSEYYLGVGGTGDFLVVELYYEFYVGNFDDLQTETGDVEVEQFTNFDVGGFLGEPTFKITGAGEEYTFAHSTWSNGNDGYYSADTRIESGVEYTLNVTISGAKIPSDFQLINPNRYGLISETITVDTTNPKFNQAYYTAKYKFEKEMIDGKEVIKSHLHNLGKLKVGHEFFQEYYSVPGATISTALLDVSTNQYIGDYNTISANKDYVLEIVTELTDPDHYVFSDNYTLNLNTDNKGDFYVSADPTTKENDTRYVTRVHYDTTLAANTIYSVKIDSLPRPMIGKGFYDVFPAPQEGHNSDNVNIFYDWYKDGERVDGYPDVFEYDSSYEMVLNIEPMPGYVLSEEFEFEYNEDNLFNPYKAYEYNDENIYVLDVQYYTYVGDDRAITGPIDIDIDKPVIGQPMKYAKNNNNPKYNLVETWYEYTDEYNYRELTSSDVYESNKDYFYVVTVQPRDGYYIYDSESLVFNIPTLNYNNHPYNYFEYNTTERLIESVYFYDVMPIEDKTPNYMLIDQFQAVDLQQSVQWYHNGQLMDPNEKFKLGETYNLKATLVPFGYNRTNSDIEIYNGIDVFRDAYDYQASGSEKKTTNKIEVNYTFKLARKSDGIYDPQPMEIGELIIGKQFPQVVNRENRVEVEAKWFEIPGGENPDIELTDGDIVERDKQYKLEITINPKNNLKLTNNTTIMIPGLEGHNYYRGGGSGLYMNQIYSDAWFDTTVAVEVEPTEMSLDSDNLTISIGKTEKLNTYFNPYETTDQFVTWTSSDDSVAIVDSFGNVKGIAEGTATITATSNYDGISASAQVTVTKLPPKVKYKTHVQSYGWQDYVENGQMSGTSGEAKRLEGIKIKLEDTPYSGEIQYRTHIQSYGWEMIWREDDEFSGTEGEAKRLEAIEIKLTGDMAEHYDVYYRVHAQSFGWLGWAKNGESAGTAGYAKRLEGIEIVLVAKGRTPEEYDPSQKPFREKEVLYRTHVQSFGWQDYAFDGGMSGTSGLAKRLEGIEIKLNNPKYDGGIRYKTHIQSYGWEKTWKENGEMSGTSGEAKRLEAIEIELTGDMAEHYDVYYRVHAQSFGWLGWAMNGQSSGTAGYAKRLEGIEIVLVDKFQEPPYRDNQNDPRPFIER